MENTTRAEELYAIWTRATSRDIGWTKWVSPVLFSQLNRAQDELIQSRASETVNADWIPSPSEKTLLVVDLPGEKALEMGMAAAKKGYRPVPIFNGCPSPEIKAQALVREIVPMRPLVNAFLRASNEMSGLSFAPDAPPAFLLDSRRMTGAWNPSPGDFDNRWIVLPEDFPSANYVLGSGIRRAILVREKSASAMDDLNHVLLRWKKSGIEIMMKESDSDFPMRSLDVPRPSRFKSMFYTALALAGLHPNSAGGFGSIIPMPSHHSG